MPTSLPSRASDASDAVRLRGPAQRKNRSPSASVQVVAPSLDALLVTVEAPRTPTADEILARYAQGVVRRRREEGEAVGRGDELWVDVIAYVNGALMPGGVRLDCRPDEELFRGLADALVGLAVGDAKAVHVTIGDAHPRAELRGRGAELIVDVVRAYEVKQAAAPANLEAALRHISEQLAREHEDEARAEARDRVLDLLTDRAFEGDDAQPADAVVEDELRCRWAEIEGARLAEKGFDAEALGLWLADPVARAETRRRLRVALTLEAIAAQEKLTAGEAALEKWVMERAVVRFV